jgi:hypothetical protein
MCAEEEVESQEDAEDAVRVVDGVGVDAVDAEWDKRGAESRGEKRAGGHQAEGDAPREQGGAAVGESCIEDDVPVDAAEEVDACCLDEEGERSVGEGEVSVGELAEGDAEAAVEEIGEVPENADVGVLPEGEGSGTQEECERGEGVSEGGLRMPGHEWIVAGWAGFQGVREP